MALFGKAKTKRSFPMSWFKKRGIGTIPYIEAYPTFVTYLRFTFNFFYLEMVSAGF